MKVLILNGSPRQGGNTSYAVSLLEEAFAEEGIETEVIQVGNKPIRGCIACGFCKRNGKCVFDDGVNEIAEKFEQADGLIAATPVYYASANAMLDAVMDRLFYCTNYDKTMKVGAAVAIARRGGIETTFDQLNKYFSISGMPVASSCYWNGAYGAAAGEAEQDVEGRRIMRTLAKNMSFLIKAIALGKEKYGLPEKEPRASMNFIR